jgi:hypothetical protein
MLRFDIIVTVKILHSPLFEKEVEALSKMVGFVFKLIVVGNLKTVILWQT